MLVAARARCGTYKQSQRIAFAGCFVGRRAWRFGLPKSGMPNAKCERSFTPAHRQHQRIVKRATDGQADRQGPWSAIWAQAEAPGRKDRHAIPTVTFGAGQNDAHTVDECIDLSQFDAACRLAYGLATMC
jgi:tripeptide aminopeptidase